jgi:myo-inositol catabolism protein IolS
MDYINLGKSNLKVSRLGFGCCPMGCYGWGRVYETEFKDAVLTAVDRGVTLFDTADVYGFGLSEKLLGGFIKKCRKNVVIATKFGVRTDSKGVTFYDNSPSWVEEALVGSLSRLGVDCIDLYQVHYLDGKTPFSDVINVLNKKRKEGKIRYFGLSNISLNDIKNFIIPKEIVSFQSEYSVARRYKEKDIECLLSQTNLSFISWGSLGQGVLTGKYGKNTVFETDDRRSRPVYVNFHEEKFIKNMEMLKHINAKFSNTNKTLSQIAIRWILDKFNNSVVLTGMKNSLQVNDNCDALTWNLSDEEIDYLDSISSSYQ